jgi:hypothetical protein
MLIARQIIYKLLILQTANWQIFKINSFRLKMNSINFFYLFLSQNGSTKSGTIILICINFPGPKHYHYKDKILNQRIALTRIIMNESAPKSRLAFQFAKKIN